MLRSVFVLSIFSLFILMAMTGCTSQSLEAHAGRAPAKFVAEEVQWNNMETQVQDMMKKTKNLNNFKMSAVQINL